MHGPAGSALGGTEADASAVAKWAARLAATDAAGLPAMAEEALAVADQPKSQKWMRLLAARWAEVDPAGGVAFFADQQKGKPSHEANPWPQIWILTEWALRDVEAAWAHVAAQSGKDESGVVINLGAELLRENPRVFWDWFLKAREPLPRQWGDPNPAWLELARQHGKTLEAMAAEMAAALRTKTATLTHPSMLACMLSWPPSGLRATRAQRSIGQNPFRRMCATNVSEQSCRCWRNPTLKPRARRSTT